jgi:hypothetical protein
MQNARFTFRASFLGPGFESALSLRIASFCNVSFFMACGADRFGGGRQMQIRPSAKLSLAPRLIYCAAFLDR